MKVSCLIWQKKRQTTPLLVIDFHKESRFWKEPTGFCQSGKHYTCESLHLLLVLKTCHQEEIKYWLFCLLWQWFLNILHQMMHNSTGLTPIKDSLYRSLLSFHICCACYNYQYLSLGWFFLISISAGPQSNFLLTGFVQVFLNKFQGPTIFLFTYNTTKSWHGSLTQ